MFILKLFRYIIMKKFLLAMLLSVTFTANAASVTDAIYDAGSIIFSGGVYIDNDVSETEGARGIANVTAIRDSSGNLLWNDSTSELNIIFSGFNRPSGISTDTFGVSTFQSTGGLVEFFEAATGTFDATGGWVSDSASIRTGVEQLLASGQDDFFGNAVYGQFASDFYSSNGYLSVDSGNWFEMLNTNSIIDRTSGLAFADMTFNISADNTANSLYSYSGSGDLATLSTRTTVPEPGALALMGIGLAGIGFTRKRKT